MSRWKYVVEARLEPAPTCPKVAMSLTSIVACKTFVIWVSPPERHDVFLQRRNTQYLHMLRARTDHTSYLCLENVSEGLVQVSETGRAWGFGSEFSGEVVSSYCLGSPPPPVFNIWQQIRIVFDTRCRANETYPEAGPAAPLQTQIWGMSDPRRFLSGEIHDLSTVNFPQSTRKKTCWESKGKFIRPSRERGIAVWQNLGGISTWGKESGRVGCFCFCF